MRDPHARSRRAVSGASLYAAASGAEAVALLALMPFVTRSVTVEAFAVWAIVRITVGVTHMVCDAGAGVAVVRYLSSASGEGPPRDTLEPTLLRSRLAIATPLALVAPLLAAAIWPARLEEVAFGAGTFWLATLNEAVGCVLRARERHARLAGGWLIRGVVRTALLVGVVVLAGWGQRGLLLTLVVGEACLLAATAGPTLPALASRGSRATFARLVRFGAPIALSYGVGAFAALDRHVIGKVSSLSAAGVYQLAAIPAAAVEILERAATFAAEPYIYGARQDERAGRLDDLVRSYAFLVIGAGLAVSMVGPELVALLGPPEYAGAITVLPLLTFAAVSDALFRVVGLAAGIAERTRPWASAAALELGAAAALVLAATPTFGAAGAGAARLIAALVGLVACWRLTRRVSSTRLPVPALLGALLAAVTAATLTATPLGAVWSLPARLALCAALLACGFLVLVSRRGRASGPSS